MWKLCSLKHSANANALALKKYNIDPQLKPNCPSRFQPERQGADRQEKTSAAN
jgi:hypothetical protein